MEAPPPPPVSSAAAVANYPDSISSSPRSRQTDSWDAEPPPPAPPQKLRLMCSYGGHIIPRPHDKCLCYIGGDTRIVVVERNSSLSDVHNRLSRTLLQDQPFSLKYQLPSEDLDSLISITTEEDLENMVEEYDRLSGSGGGLKTGRLRLFLFPKSLNVEQILVKNGSTKSEDWFVDALNGGKAAKLSVGGNDRGFSESSSVNCLLGLEDNLLGRSEVELRDVEARMQGTKGSGEVNGNDNNSSVLPQDAHSVPGSPMLETSSSLGSTSSSPSIANLPPIKLPVAENPKACVLGIDGQFQLINVGSVGVGKTVNLSPQKQEEAGDFVAAGVGAAATVVSGLPAVVGGDYAKMVFPDDERSDHGGQRKVQQIQQPQQVPQYQQRQGGPFDLASPHSVSSEGSLANPLSRQTQVMYQEPIIQIQPRNSKITDDLKTGDQNNNRVQMQPQIQESGYFYSGPFDQNHPQLHLSQQFIHAGMQYIPAAAVPMASYYPVYPSQQQHQPHQPILDQQYPFYLVPARQAQAYNLPTQATNYGESGPAAPSSRPQTAPASIAPFAAYNQANNPPSQPEMASGVYRTTTAPPLQYVQVPSSQYTGFAQMHHHLSQSMAPSAAATSTYAFDPTLAHVQGTQPEQPEVAAQYQMLTSTSAVVLPEASMQVPSDNITQQVRTSHP